jgi:hypothetical protein
MLHYSKIVTAIYRKQKGEPVRFSFKAVAKSTGELITGDNCTCTSHFVHTVNIRWPSGEVRKLRKALFIEINENKIFI